MFHTLNAPRAHQLQFRPLAHVVLMMFDDDDAFGYSGRVRAAERAWCECVCVCGVESGFGRIVSNSSLPVAGEPGRCRGNTPTARASKN